MLTRTILLILICVTVPAHAMDWQRYFYTPDQRGQKAMQAEQPEVAASQFVNPAWKGSAYYRAKDYDSALDNFNQSEDATTLYNKGNTLARKGDFAAAIQAYDHALKKQTDFPDAQFNKELLEKLKEKEQEQKQDQPQDKNQQPQQDQSSPSDGESQPSGEDQSKQDNAPKPKSDSGQQPAQNQPQPKPEKQDKVSPHETLSQREREDIDQELNNIPNDPGGLLRQKFLRDHQRYQQESS